MNAYYEVQERDTNKVRAHFEFLSDAVDFWGLWPNDLKIVPTDEYALNLMHTRAKDYGEYYHVRIASRNRQWNQ